MSIERTDILLEWIAKADSILDAPDVTPNKIKELIENNRHLFHSNPIVGDRLSLLAKKMKNIALEKNDRDYAEKWIETSQYVTLPEELNNLIRQKLQTVATLSALHANPFFQNLIVGDKQLHRDVLINFALEKILTAYRKPKKNMYNFQLIQPVVLEICRIQALKNPEEMYRLFEQIPQSEFKDRAFKHITKGFALANNIGRALEIAECIETSEEQEGAFSGIATVQASTNIDKALQITERIQRPGIKDLALKDIAIAQASTNIEKALEIAERIEHKETRYSVFDKIAIEQSATDIEKALQIVQRPEMNHRKDDSFIGIARAQASTNMEKALKITERIENRVKKNAALFIVAFDSENLEDALKAVDRISDYCKAVHLKKIVKKWALADPEKVLGIPNRFPITKNQILEEIANAQAGTNIKQAMDTLNSIQDNSEKELAIAAVANELAKTNIDKALGMAERISDINLKYKTETEIRRIHDFAVSRAIQTPRLSNPTEQFAEIHLIKDNLSKVQALLAFALIATPHLA